MPTTLQICSLPPGNPPHVGSPPSWSGGALQVIARVTKNPQLQAELDWVGSKRNSTTIGTNTGDNARGAKGVSGLLETNQIVAGELKGRSTLHGGCAFGPSDALAKEKVANRFIAWTCFMMSTAVAILTFCAVIAAEVLL